VERRRLEQEDLDRSVLLCCDAIRYAWPGGLFIASRSRSRPSSSRTSSGSVPGSSRCVFKLSRSRAMLVVITLWTTAAADTARLSTAKCEDGGELMTQSLPGEKRRSKDTPSSFVFLRPPRSCHPLHACIALAWPDFALLLRRSVHHVQLLNKIDTVINSGA
jgi:hypothetical protein